tara:strand:- start:23 stop:217 length:195 start_codon:yes stop_codon:yes gene_type:complete
MKQKRDVSGYLEGMVKKPIPDKMAIVPEIISGVPTSPPMSHELKKKAIPPTTINKMGIIFLIIS